MHFLNNGNGYALFDNEGVRQIRTTSSYPSASLHVYPAGTMPVDVMPQARDISLLRITADLGDAPRSAGQGPGAIAPGP